MKKEGKKAAVLLAFALIFGVVFSLPENKSAPFFISATAESRMEKGGRFPKGVKVDGIPVGGMKKKEAFALLRKEDIAFAPYLRVRTPKGETRFFAPEIGFLDDLEEIFSSAQKKGEYSRSVRWFLKGEEEKISRLCDDNEKRPISAALTFSKDGFCYFPHREGVSCDEEKLKEDILRALSSPIEKDEKGRRRFPLVQMQTKAVYPACSLNQLQKRTQPLAHYTTYYSVEDRGRCENIRLAAALLDGSTILSGQSFSFNAMVGERTKKRGFRDAKIIQSGEFVSGAGGGVCQVSTTLYNAALKAGMKILERRPHSLAVGYVEPSRDAMVSSCSDLRFQNPYPEAVYLSVKTGEGWIKATFYGKNRGIRYEIASVVLGEIPPPEPIVKPAKEDGEIKKGKAGIKSEAYLERYEGGVLTQRKRLSADVYAPIRGVVGKKNENPIKKMP